jgi:protein-disulfide isomerase
MMHTKLPFRRLQVFVSVVLSSAAVVSAQTVATVDGTRITQEQLDKASANRLTRLKAEEYDIQRRVLESLVDQALLDREAQRRSISTNDLLRLEVGQKNVTMSDAEAKAVYEAVRERYSDVTESEAIDRIRATTNAQRLDNRRKEFLSQLRAKVQVSISLPIPRLKIVSDPEDGSPSIGGQDAPVTIVEFTDFQCPFCAKSVATLKQISATYGDRVRVVFRHFPLPSHKDAFRTSLAVQCAANQHKFWPMHDIVFGHPDKVQPDDLRQYASAVGVDIHEWDECIKSPMVSDFVKKDQSAGEEYGVSATPTFFINGRPLLGAQPLDVFKRTIDEELELSSRSRVQ